MDKYTTRDHKTANLQSDHVDLDHQFLPPFHPNPRHVLVRHKISKDTSNIYFHCHKLAYKAFIHRERKTHKMLKGLTLSPISP